MDQVPIFIRSASYSQAHIRSPRFEIVYKIFFKNRPLTQIIFIIYTPWQKEVSTYACATHTHAHIHTHTYTHVHTHIYTNILTHIHIHTRISFGKAPASFSVPFSQWSSPSLNCVQRLPLPLAAEAIVFVPALVKCHDWFFSQSISTEVLVFTYIFVVSFQHIYWWESLDTFITPWISSK